MIPAVYQKLILEMLRWMEVFARRFFPVTSTLKEKMRNLINKAGER